MTKYVICVDIGCEDIQTPYLSVFFLFFFGGDFSWHNRLSNIAKLLQHMLNIFILKVRDFQVHPLCSKFPNLSLQLKPASKKL